MEITGKVLREVEFRDRLRGYDTDEVDEFLEQVAVAVDDLQRRASQTASRQPAAEEQAGSADAIFDDDSIRRTLVLAQRTADLAIKEAKEEAGRLLEEARHTAEELVAQATATVARLRAEADEDYSTRVGAQLAQREQLERDVRNLNSLVSEERDRIADSLQTVLRYVAENLSISPEVSERAAPASAPLTDQAPAAAPAPSGSADRLFEDDDDLDLSDIHELELEPPSSFTAPIPTVPSSGGEASTDPDEELWQRWAQSDQLEENDGDDPTADPFGFDRRP